MTRKLKYFGLIFLLIACSSENKKGEIESTEKDSINKLNNAKYQLLKPQETDHNEIDAFLITENSVGIFEKGMTVNEVLQTVPKSQIKKKTGHGEFADDTYDDFEIYDKDNKHLLTLTPSTQNDSAATINRVLILDNRFKTESGIGIESSYAELIKTFKKIDYTPDVEHIVLTVGQIGAWFTIKKSELDSGWWNENVKAIDKSKIPPDVHFDSIVIWWN